MTAPGPHIPEHDVAAALGEEAIGLIVRSFYRRVEQDTILGPMYRQSPEASGLDPAAHMAAAADRLRDYLIYRFGGPDRYQPRRGHPRLRMRHHPFPIDLAARDRWIELFRASIVEVAGSTPLDPRARATLEAFVEHMATFLINRG